MASRCVCKWRVQPCDSYLKERFLSLIVCLFYPHFSFFFFSSYFFVIRIFFLHPHFCIRIFPSASAIRGYPVLVLQTPWDVLFYYRWWPIRFDNFAKAMINSKINCFTNKRNNTPVAATTNFSHDFQSLIRSEIEIIQIISLTNYCHNKTFFQYSKFRYIMS